MRNILAENKTMENNPLSPVFKWTGGKRREINIFIPYFPDFVSNNNSYNYVEPFVGGAAVYWFLNNVNGKNFINDYDYDVSNFYSQMKQQNKDFVDPIIAASLLYTKNSENTHAMQEQNYYHWRNKDRDNGLSRMSDTERAARFWIVNQLAFSGMRRFNAAGYFNVPYGHYKNLNPKLITSEPHIKLLNSTTIYNDDYSHILNFHDQENTFIFLDPPYTRVMKKYSADASFGDEQQRYLAEQLLSLKQAKWMLIIDKSELTQQLYANNIKTVYSLKYGVNIRNRFSTDVQHLIVTNY